MSAPVSGAGAGEAAQLPSGTVTFLHADVEGSTQLLRELGREMYAVVLDGQRALLRESAATERGVVVDSEGDGMLVAFPSARAALAAAVATQRALAGARWGDDRISVRVRMGLDSGEVMLRSQSYIGVPLHRGARICQAGRGGQVLLSAATRALVGTELPDRVEVQELGAVALDGFAEPEELFQIVSDDLPDSAGTPRVRPHQPRNRILERQSEVGALEAIVADARHGSGTVVVVEGPAGIGKSSLLEAARGYALKGGVPVLGARGGELEVDYPFGVVRQLFEPVAREAEDAEALFAGAAALARHIVDGAAVPATTDGYAILHGLYWLTANIAERGPLLLIVDDLQWCDVASLRFLAYLAPRVQDTSLALLVAARSGEPPLDEQAFAALTSDISVRRIVPRPLSEAAISELLLGAFAARPDPAFVQACKTATSANPLLLHELLGALVAAGAKPTAAWVGAIPELGADAVSRFVLRRLARLSQAAGAVAAATAVLGDQAELGTVAALAQLERPVAADAAGSLARADVLAAGPQLRFVHPLVRDAVYRALAPSEREEAHARVAKLLLGGSAASEPVVFPCSDPSMCCALHLLHAAPASVPGAAGMLRDAARLSLAEGAPASAIGFLQRMLAEPMEPAERALGLRELGTAELRLDPRSAAMHLREALALLDDPDQRDEAALLLGRALYAAGESLEAAELLEGALAGRTDSESDLSQRIQAELVGALFESLQDARAAEHLPDIRALTADTTLGGRMLRAQLSTQLAGGEASRRQAIELATEAVADDLLLADETSDIFMWATATLMAAGEYALARSALDRALERASRGGSMQLFVTASHFRARLFHELGELAEAEADARAALQVLELHHLPVALPWLASVLGNVLIERGRLDEADDALELAPPGERKLEPASVILTRVRLALARDRPEEALLEIAEVRRRFATESALQHPWRSLSARALATLGRLDEALPLAYEEVERARVWGAPRPLGHALRVAGLLAGGSEGLGLLREAIAVLEGSSARLELAHALAALGAVTRRAGRRVEARELLRSALELAELCGAGALESAVRAELVATGARPRRAMLTGVDALTPSELRVAQLAAGGKSNRAIAQALFVTLKTVEMHLAGSYRKLGISSRSELPALLGERPVAAHS